MGHRAGGSFHSFVFLHKLGNSLLSADAGPVLATRRADGSVAILLWNLIPADEGGVANGNPIGASAGAQRSAGAARQFRLKLSGIPDASKVSISQVNNEVGTAIPKWRAMGSPKYPSANQIADLRSAAELPRPEQRTLAGGQDLSIELPPDGIALIEITRH